MTQRKNFVHSVSLPSRIDMLSVFAARTVW